MRIYIFTVCECVCGGGGGILNENLYRRVYLGASIPTESRCVDAEWQLKKCESCGQKRGRAGMTVAEMKGGSRQERPRDLSECDCVMCRAIFSPHVCQWEDKPWETQRLLGERKRVCCAQWGVCRMRGIVPVCVCQGMAQIQSAVAVASERFWKKKSKHKCLALQWRRWSEERPSNPLLAGSRDLPGQICNSEQPPLGLRDRFPCDCSRLLWWRRHLSFADSGRRQC